MKTIFETLPFRMPGSIRAAQDAQVGLVGFLQTFETGNLEEVTVRFTGSSWNMDQHRKPWFSEPRQDKYISAETYSNRFNKGFAIKIVSQLPAKKLYSALKKFTTRKELEEFARVLETRGFTGAIDLVVDDLLPIAQEQGISILAAANRYANCDEEQDTSFYILSQVLLKVGRSELEDLDIHRPL